MLLAIWFIHSPFALLAMPAISTFLVDRSIKNRTQEALQSSHGPDLDREEIGSHDQVLVLCQKLSQVVFGFAPGLSRSMPAKNSSDCAASQLMPRFESAPLDSTI